MVFPHHPSTFYCVYIYCLFIFFYFYYFVKSHHTLKISLIMIHHHS